MKKLDGLKASVDKLADHPSVLKDLFTGVVQDIAVSYITDPANKTIFMNSIKASFSAF